jgi:hypothetical protein
MKAIIDRFEGDMAVVLIGEDKIHLDVPRKLLPKNAKEGSWLNVVFELDPEVAEKQKQQISSLLERLQNKTRQMKPSL